MKNSSGDLAQETVRSIKFVTPRILGSNEEKAWFQSTGQAQCRMWVALTTIASRTATGRPRSGAAKESKCKRDSEVSLSGTSLLGLKVLELQAHHLKKISTSKKMELQRLWRTTDVTKLTDKDLYEFRLPKPIVPIVSGQSSTDSTSLLLPLWVSIMSERSCLLPESTVEEDDAQRSPFP